MFKYSRLGSSALIVTLVGASLLGCTSASSGSADPTGAADEYTLEDMEPITLSWSEMVAEDVSEGVLAWMNYIEEETNGKVTIEPYWSASLFPPNETLQQVRSGVADIASMSSSLAPDDLPVTTSLLPLGAATDPSFPLGYLQSMGATAEFFYDNADIAEEMDSHNVMVMSGQSTVHYGLLCREDVQTPEQAAGTRTRVGGGAWVDEIGSLGMAPEFTPITEAYEALQRGILDCAIWPESNFEMFSMWDVAKYYVPTSFSNFPGSMTIINKDVWESFPNDLKQIFIDGSAHMVAAQAKSVTTDIASFIDKAEKVHGVSFGDPTAIDAIVSGVQREKIETFAEYAPDAIADPEAFRDEYQEDLAEWLEIFTDAGYTSGSDQTKVAQAAAVVADQPKWSGILLNKLLEHVKGRYSD